MVICGSEKLGREVGGEEGGEVGRRGGLLWFEMHGLEDERRRDEPKNKTEGFFWCVLSGDEPISFTYSLLKSEGSISCEENRGRRLLVGRESVDETKEEIEWSRVE